MQPLGAAEVDVGLGLHRGRNVQQHLGAGLSDVGKVIFDELGKLALRLGLLVIAHPLFKLRRVFGLELGPVIAPAWLDAAMVIEHGSDAALVGIGVQVAGIVRSLVGAIRQQAGHILERHRAAKAPWCVLHFLDGLADIFQLEVFGHDSVHVVARFMHISAGCRQCAKHACDLQNFSVCALAKRAGWLFHYRTSFIC